MPSQVFLKREIIYQNGIFLDNKTSVRKATKALWLSVIFTVLFVASMSFLLGQFPEMSLDGTPTQDRDSSCMSLECIS
ncbi:hypothetical protein GH733_002805 [Mirounga leonina]|nr:hypothetical protein GH733_002805 [Mirounga leonina]